MRVLNIAANFDSTSKRGNHNKNDKWQASKMEKWVFYYDAYRRNTELEKSEEHNLVI